MKHQTQTNYIRWKKQLTALQANDLETVQKLAQEAADELFFKKTSLFSKPTLTN